jgi:hypothetical protein
MQHTHIYIYIHTHTTHAHTHIGIVQLLVSADMMFPMSKMPERMSQLPDVVTFVVYWFLVVPYVTVMFAAMFP